MPQFQQHKKGMARIRVLSKDSTRAYMLLMQKTGGKLQALPNDVFVLEESLLALLTENKIAFEVMETKSASNAGAMLNYDRDETTKNDEVFPTIPPSHRRHFEG